MKLDNLVPTHPKPTYLHGDFNKNKPAEMMRHYLGLSSPLTKTKVKLPGVRLMKYIRQSSGGLASFANSAREVWASLVLYCTIQK
jgi:hypothetical protein